VKLPRSNPKRGRVEIIPLIDTILILLIFYMSFSKFELKEKNMEAKLPALTVVQRENVTEVPLDVTLHVKSLAQIVVNDGAQYDATTLKDAMAQLGMMGQKVTVVIGADPDTDYQAVIAALDACAQANLTKVAFRPLPEKKATP